MPATSDRLEQLNQVGWLAKAKRDAESLYDTLLDLQHHVPTILEVEPAALNLARLNLLGLMDVLNAIEPRKV